MKKYFSVFWGVFGFLVFGDGVALGGQNQFVPQAPDYVCAPMKNYDPAMCISHGAGNPFGPLAGRIPVIFIHGWNPKEIPGEPDLIVWRGLARHFYESRWFNERHKMYFVVYLSNLQGIGEMGLTFGSLIDQMNQIDPDFGSKPIILVGYSMGGLIARAYMQEPSLGQPGLRGERVLRLITFGTPHHGSPFANGPARDHKAGNLAGFLSQFVDRDLFGLDVRWHMPNRLDLHWDNYDGLLDYKNFNEYNFWLNRLNSGERFKNKIVAYGGMIRRLDKIEDCLLFWGLPSCLAAIMNKALGVSESDGVVPVASALFDPCPECVATRIYPGYDHGEIVRGKTRFFQEPEPLFESIASDLFKAIVSVPPGGITVSISANPNPAAYNTQSYLSWSSSNAEHCVLYVNGQDTGWRGLSRLNVPTGNLLQFNVYRVDCINSQGGYGLDYVTVNVKASLSTPGILERE